MQDFFINANQGKIYAACWGYTELANGKPPIILIHDSLGCVALWRDFPALLSSRTGHVVIAYDRLGFGKSDPYPGLLPQSFISDEAIGTFDNVRKFFEIENFILLGHSVGGGMSVASAGYYPNECVALITESAQSFVEGRTLQEIRKAKQLFSSNRELRRLEKYHGSKAAWVLSAWVDTWLSDSFISWNLDSALSRVKCPTLALHGENDEYGSDQHPKRIVSFSQGCSKMIIIPDCGHVPHREHRDFVLCAIEEFLTKVLDLISNQRVLIN